MKLKTRSLILFGTTTILILLLLNGWAYFLVQDMVTDLLLTRLDSLGYMSEARIQSVIDHNKDRLAGITSRTQLRLDFKDFLVNGSEQKRSNVKKIMRDAKASITNLQDIMIVNPAGMVVIATDERYEGTFLSNEIFPDVQSFSVLVALHNESFYASGPLTLDGEVLGRAIIKTSLSDFEKIVKNYTGLGKTGEILFAVRSSDGHGEFVHSRRFESEAKFKVITNLPNVVMAHALRGTEELFANAGDYRGVQVLAATRHIEEIHLDIVVKIDRKEVFSTLLPLQIMLSIILFLIILCLIILIMIVYSLANSILQLKTITEQVKGGNLDAAMDFNPKTWSQELLDLIENIKEMVRSIRQYEEKVSKHEQQLEQHEKALELQIQQRTNELEGKVDELGLSKKATLNILEDMEETNKAMIVTQNQLEQSLKEVKKLDTQKDQFISIAAHELKTPLTSIKGFTDLLKKEVIMNNPELRQKYLGIIFRDTKRLSELISNILELSRMDIGTLKLAFQPIKVADLIDEVKEQMNIIIIQKGLESEFFIEKDLPVVTIDKDRMVQVISNLINNAVHYTDKGKISVHAQKSEDSVLFSVQDTGQGIPKEFHGKIFERFYQVDSPLTRKIGGTGLGLSLSKGFVEAMGGKIWFESDAGKGATFYFTIPTENSGKAREKELNIFKETKE